VNGGRNPDAAIDLIVKREALVNRAIEKQRLLYVTRTLIATPEASELGVGDTKDARMADAIDIIATSFELPRKPAVADVFSRAFLPPKDERLLAKTTN
jgi:NitT/TauT family transport system substrate-binding protein